MKRATRPAARGSRRRGSSMVESVLILFVFLVMFIGILDFGYFLFVHQSLVERARSGARYATVNAYNVDAVKNMILYSQETTPQTPTTGYLGLTASNINVQRYSPDTDEDRLAVTISGYQVQYFSPLMAKVASALPITVTIPYEHR
jgi:Flp pilus assembly protein TadG